MKAGSQKEVDVWQEFAGDPVRLSRVARSIRRLMLVPDEIQPQELHPEEFHGDSFETDFEAPEGVLLTRFRERSSALVQARKAQALKSNGALSARFAGSISLYVSGNAEWALSSATTGIRCRY